MNIIRYIAISIISGLTAIIPGVSGGTIFAIFGISEKLAKDITYLSQSLTYIFKSFNKFLEGLIKYGQLPIIIGIGSLISSIAFANIIVIVGQSIEYFLRFLFIGMVLFSLPTLWKETNTNTTYNRKYLYAIIGFGIACFLFLNNNSLVESQIENYNSFSFIFKFFIVSLIAGITTILPGISGTNIIILGGVYNDYILFSSNLSIYLPQYFVFLLGTVIGTIVAAKVIEVLLSRFRTGFFSLMSGLTASTLFVIWANPFSSIGSLFQGILGIIISFLLIKTLTSKQSKLEDNLEIKRPE